MYIQIVFNHVQEHIKDWLIANLKDDAEGFEEGDTHLKAIFLPERYNNAFISSLAAQHHISYQKNIIEQQNWNALWESNFEPVLVDDFVGIRASFHQPIEHVAYEIIITPKMSFGTGHHATTYLMMKQMQKINFHNKSVFDFGTGTGVLAILAKKLGASKVVATDIDKWSIENAKENFEHNHVTDIQLLHTDSCDVGSSFDIILANINRNVLLNNIPILASQLCKGGQLVLSGILSEDISAIINCGSNSSLQHTYQAEKNNWICLIFNKL